MIWEELKKNLIFTGMEASDTKEVFEKMGGALIREGYAKKSYIEGLVERERDYPTGLDIDGIGVAIPHTPVQYTNATGTAIGILKAPVSFHEMGGDDEDTVQVRVVIMLCVNDPKTHMDKLQKIIEMIQNRSLLENMEKAEDADTIIALIRQTEENMQEA